MGPEPAGALLHKSMPMFKLVPGTEPTGLPGTEFGKLVGTPLFCALAPGIKSQSHQSKQNSGQHSGHSRSLTFGKHLVKASFLGSREVLENVLKHMLQ